MAGDPEVLVPPRIGWRKGVVMIGTVNVDETTFSFAPKVLDRSAVLEFVDVNLPLFFKESGRSAHWERLGPWFEAVQAVTRPYNLHLGYRAANEVVNVVRAELGGEPASWPEDRLASVLQRQLRNKVLPRVRGARGTAEPVLLGLLALALAGPSGYVEQLKAIEVIADRGYETGDLKDLRKKASWGSAAEKAWQMVLRLRDVGFTGFF